MVIAIHTQASNSLLITHTDFWTPHLLLDQSARFAVPLFFVISGYFWGIRLDHGTSITAISSQMAKRIFTIFIAWSLIYLLPYNVGTINEFGFSGPIKAAYWSLARLAQEPLVLLTQGTKIHLWFLLSLLWALGICAFFVAKKCYKTLAIFSIALYVVGLLAKAYADTPFGIPTSFNTRNGPFFGTVFFASGFFLSHLKPNETWFAKGIALLIAGGALHFFEIYTLWHLYGTSPYQDYVAGTYLMGIGAAMAALSNKRFFMDEIFHKAGKLTLGVYAAHFLFVEILGPAENLFSSKLWHVCYIALALALSIATASVLSQFPLTKKIVM
ncbi:MAG: hypothetical protein JWL63_639 [Rhodocyclales bacterium]|nr:hypothetical protein [Rhodocyclales bacterium]